MEDSFNNNLGFFGFYSVTNNHVFPIFTSTTAQTGTTSSQSGHQLQSSNQCWGDISPHLQISGHWRVLHIIILSVQGLKIHHFQVSTRGLQGLSSPDSTSNVLLPQMSGKNWRGNSGSDGMFHMPWELWMGSMWP